MSFITQESLDGQLDLPISAPTVQIDAGKWIVVSSVMTVDPMQIVLRWLQLQLVEVINPFTNGTVVVAPNAQGLCVFPPSDILLTNPDYGLAYLGLYKEFSPPVDPSLQSLQEPPLVVGGVNTTASAISSRNTSPTAYATPGIYSMVLVNNTTNRTLKLTVNGQLRVLLSPS